MHEIATTLNTLQYEQKSPLRMFLDTNKYLRTSTIDRAKLETSFKMHASEMQGIDPQYTQVSETHGSH